MEDFLEQMEEIPEGGSLKFRSSYAMAEGWPWMGDVLQRLYPWQAFGGPMRQYRLSTEIRKRLMRMYTAQ